LELFYCNLFPVIIERFIAGREQFDHFQTDAAVIDRRLVFFETFEEIFAFHGQSLALIELAPGVTLEMVAQRTAAHYVVDLDRR